MLSTHLMHLTPGCERCSMTVALHTLEGVMLRAARCGLKVIFNTATWPPGFLCSSIYKHHTVPYNTIICIRDSWCKQFCLCIKHALYNAALYYQNATNAAIVQLLLMNHSATPQIVDLYPHITGTSSMLYHKYPQICWRVVTWIHQNTLQETESWAYTHTLYVNVNHDMHHTLSNQTLMQARGYHMWITHWADRRVFTYEQAQGCLPLYL